MGDVNDTRRSVTQKFVGHAQLIGLSKVTMFLRELVIFRLVLCCPLHSLRASLASFSPSNFALRVSPRGFAHVDAHIKAVGVETLVNLLLDI